MRRRREMLIGRVVLGGWRRGDGRGGEERGRGGGVGGVG